MAFLQSFLVALGLTSGFLSLCGAILWAVSYAQQSFSENDQTPKEDEQEGRPSLTDNSHATPVTAETLPEEKIEDDDDDGDRLDQVYNCDDVETAPSDDSSSQHTSRAHPPVSKGPKESFQKLPTLLPNKQQNGSTPTPPRRTPTWSSLLHYLSIDGVAEGDEGEESSDRFSSSCSSSTGGTEIISGGENSNSPRGAKHRDLSFKKLRRNHSLVDGLEDDDADSILSHSSNRCSCTVVENRQSSSAVTLHKQQQERNRRRGERPRDPKQSPRSTTTSAASLAAAWKLRAICQEPNHAVLCPTGTMCDTSSSTASGENQETSSGTATTMASSSPPVSPSVLAVRYARTCGVVPPNMNPTAAAATAAQQP